MENIVEEDKPEGTSPNEEDIENTDQQESDHQDTDDSVDEELTDSEDESLEYEDDSEGIMSEGLVEKRGCLKGCLLPIIVMILIILGLGMIIHAKRDIIREWLVIRIVSNTQDRVLTNLPKNMDRKPIEATFIRVKKAIKENTIDEQEMNQAIEEYIDTTKGMKPDELKTDIEKLMKTLNEAIHPPE
jgi:hypothetical protein